MYGLTDESCILNDFGKPSHILCMEYGYAAGDETNLLWLYTCSLKFCCNHLSQNVITEEMHKYFLQNLFMAFVMKCTVRVYPCAYKLRY